MAFDETSQEPFMTLSKRIVYSIGGGAIIALLTSLLPNNTVIGASNFGYPFPWLFQPLYPVGIPPTIIWEGLAIDIIVWVIVSFVIINIYHFIKSR